MSELPPAAPGSSPSSSKPSPPRRRHRRRRVWRIGLGVLLGVALALAVVTAWLLGTESGAQFVLTSAQQRLPGTLRVEDLQGSLAGTLELEGLDWQLDPDTGLRVDRLRVDWQPTGLLSGRWQVGEVRVDALHVRAAGEGNGGSTQPAVGLRGLVAWPVRIGSLRVAPIEVTWGERAFRLERLNLRASSELGVLAVDRLRVEHARGFLALEGRVDPEATTPVDVTLSWEARLPQGPPLAAEGRLHGDLERVAIEQTFSKPVPWRLDGEVRDPLGVPAAKLHAEMAETDLSRVWAPLPAWRAGLDVDAQARSDGHVAIDARARVAESPWGAASVRLRGHRLAEQVWRVEELAVHRGRARGRLAGTALVGPDVAPAVTGELRWEAVGWPLHPDERSGSTVPPSSGVARLRIGREGLLARAVEASWLDGRWWGSAAVVWSEQISGRLRLTAEQISPEALPVEWPGRVGGTIRGRGTLREESWHAALDLERLEGELAGEPVQASGRAATDGRGVEVRELELSWAGARASLDGHVGRRWDGRASVEVPDLTALWPGAGGGLTLESRITGRRERPRISIAAQGERLEVAGYRAGRASLDASVATFSPGALTAALEIDRLTGPGLADEAGRVALKVDGDLDGQRAQLEAAGGERRLEMKTRGSFQTKPQSWLQAAEGRWVGQVEALRVRDPGLGEWSTVGTPRLVVGPDGASVARTCLSSEESSLCLEGGWRRADGSWQGELVVRELAVERLAELWPAGLDVRGSARLEASVVGRQDGPHELSLAGELSPGRLGWQSEGRQTRIDHGGGRLELALDAEGARGQGTLDLGKLGQLEGRLELGPPKGDQTPLEALARRPLDARATLRVASIRPLAPLADVLADVDGHLTGRVHLGGTWQAPRTSGRLHLEEGTARVPALGAIWEQVELTAETAPGDRIELSGSGRSGEGTLVLSGGAGLPKEEALKVSLQLQGQRLTLVDRPVARVLADPELTVEIEPQRLSVDGRVLIPEAEIHLDKRPEPPMEPSPDTVVVAGERVAKPPGDGMPQELAGTVRIEFGEDVRISGEGLEARLEGEVVVEQVPGEPVPTGDGVIRLEDGVYSAYGRKLQIQRGKLLFVGGAIDDPSLDVVAARKARDGTLAGVRITGRASSPEVALWSEPEMPNEDALAYLLFGRPMEVGGMGESDRGVFERAATSLGVGGGSALVKRLGRRLGLDKARIEPGGTLQDAALVLGKYLSPRLYVGYGVGLFEPVNRFRLRYMLSPHWTLEAESGEDAGGDLLYVIERPKR